MRTDPYMKELSKESEDTTKFWVGPDMHGFIYTWKNGRDCAWVLAHMDDANIGESWSLSGNKEDVKMYLKKAGFPQVWHSILAMTPEDTLIDYKLVWREAPKTWLSPSHRSALMGDAAHCYLPTSAQGACMAVEDAAAIAICLQKAKNDIPLALQVLESIRFNRSHVIHQGSISTRNICHKHDRSPEMVEKNPTPLVMPLFDWIMDFDVQKNAEEHFEHIAKDVKSGKKGTIEELALPAGGDYNILKLAV